MVRTAGNFTRISCLNLFEPDYVPRSSGYVALREFKRVVVVSLTVVVSLFCALPVEVQRSACKCVKDQTSFQELTFPANSPISKDCGIFVSRSISEFMTTNDEVAKIINSVPKNPKVGVFLGPLLSPMIFALDANNKRVFLP
jgi:hypothetical protein